MAAKVKSHWADCQIIFKNVLLSMESKQNRAQFILLASPFLLTKEFPDVKLKNWALKCEIISNNLLGNKSYNQSMNYMNFVIHIVSAFCLFLDMADVRDNVRNASIKLKHVKSVDTAMKAVLPKVAVYHHLRAMFTLPKDEKDFPVFIIILISMYDDILSKIEDPVRLENICQLSQESEDYRIKGNNLFKNEKYEDAIKFYSSALNASPYSATLYSNRSIAHLKIKSNLKAFYDAILALIIDPMWPKVFYRLAEVIEQLNGPNDAFQVIQDGLRHCAASNLNGKEVDQLINLRKTMLPKVKLEPWFDIETGDENEVVNLDSFQAEEAYFGPFSGAKQELVANYNIQLDLLVRDCSKASPREILTLKFCLALAHCKHGSKEDLSKSLNLADSLIADTDQQFKKLGYFVVAFARYKSFRFKDCQIAALTALKLLADGSAIDEEPVIHWVNSDQVPIAVTLPGQLKRELSSLVIRSENPITPTAICRYEPQDKSSKKIFHEVAEIYELQYEYNGYVKIHCTENCRVQFHHKCWKYFKEDGDVKNDQDLLGKKCSMPYCNGFFSKLNVVHKDENNNQQFEYTKQEATKKQQHRSKSQDKVKKNGSECIEKKKDAQPAKDDIKMELFSKMKNLSANFDKISNNAKENKSEIEFCKKNIEKLKLERKKFQEDYKSYKSEQKVRKSDKLRLEQNFATLQKDMQAIKSELEKEKASKSVLERSIIAVKNQCDLVSSQSKQYRVEMLKQKRDFGKWTMAWSVMLAQHKLNDLVNSNGRQECVMSANAMLEDLFNKKQIFQLNMDDLISESEKNLEIGEFQNVLVPIEMDKFTSLLDEFLKNQSRDKISVGENRSSVVGHGLNAGNVLMERIPAEQIFSALRSNSQEKEIEIDHPTDCLNTQNTFIKSAIHCAQLEDLLMEESELDKVDSALYVGKNSDQTNRSDFTQLWSYVGSTEKTLSSHSYLNEGAAGDTRYDSIDGFKNMPIVPPISLPKSHNYSRNSCVTNEVNDTSSIRFPSTDSNYKVNRDPIATGRPHNKKLNKVPHRKKLILHLKSYFPSHSESMLNMYIEEVRHHNNNKLTGMSMEEIISLVANIVCDKEGYAKRSKEHLKAAPKAPWHNHIKSKWEQDLNNGSIECAICQEEIDAKVVEKLDCGHSFHIDCINTWLSKEKTCPNCRLYVLPSEEFPVLQPKF